MSDIQANNETTGKKLWFKAKKYGWGWTPVSWEGWLALVVFIGFNIYNYFQVQEQTDTITSALVSYIIWLLITTGILIFICYKKGEKPTWKWGNKAK